MQGGDTLALHHTVNRDQYLHAMADGEDRLLALVKMADDRLNARVDPDIFWTTTAGDVDGIVIGRLRFAERLVERVEMSVFFGISLVAFEIVQRRLDVFSCLAVGANDMHRVADSMHRLLENEYL